MKLCSPPCSSYKLPPHTLTGTEGRPAVLARDRAFASASLATWTLIRKHKAMEPYTFCAGRRANMRYLISAHMSDHSQHIVASEYLPRTRLIARLNKHIAIESSSRPFLLSPICLRLHAVSSLIVSNLKSRSFGFSHFPRTRSLNAWPQEASA